MFNDKYGLTAAVLNRSKTQTRRIINTMPKKPRIEYCLENESGNVRLFDGDIVVAKSKYNIGDVVAVAQSYRQVGYNFLSTKISTFDLLELVQSQGYDNKMFVKAELMPHQIEITGVKVERLQDINDKDCIAEGIIKYANGIYTYVENGEKIYRLRLDTPRKAYAALIDSISGKGSWATNPYVFVYEFQLIKK